MTFSSAFLGLVLLAQGRPEQFKVHVQNNPTPARRTAVSGRAGFFHGTGLGIRHHWHERVSTELSAFALFGGGLGQSLLTMEVRVVPIRRPKFWLHVCAPLSWEYQRKRRYKELGLVPDPRVRRESMFFVGIGPGVEVFVHPLVSLAMDFPFGAVWLRGEGQGPEPIVSPSMGLYVYFR